MHKANRVATERRSGRTPGVENGRKDSAFGVPLDLVLRFAQQVQIAG
jgi:hypothetical protein